MKYSFLNKIDNTVYFVGNLMEIYIPTEFFDINLAKHKGDKINTLGLFEFIIYADENDRNKKSGERHLLKLPMYIEFQYEESFRAKNVMGENPDNYTVFVLRKGNMFIDSTEKEMNSGTVKDFLFKLHAGKIPNNIPYPDIFKIYMDSLSLNEVNLENNAVAYEVTIAELYRDKNDETIPFRMSVNRNPKLSMTDYQSISIKQLPDIKGTFQSMMFENMRQSIQYSILRTKTDAKDVETPLESVAKL